MQSLVKPFGYSVESCGYCKHRDSGHRTPNSRASYYFSSTSLTVQVYQDLVDRGWRRSGTIFYKPDVLRHCCPHYTIRLPVAEYESSKTHRQALNRWNRYVLGDDYVKEAAKLHPKSKEEKARQRNTFDLSTVVHESEYASLKRPPEPAHKFEVTLEPDTLTDEKYELFKNYQQNVHHEKPSDISKGGFQRFLCGSPLRRADTTADGKTRKLGSYHQCYRLDGRLIAMSVLDLLPHCVSGVYFVYHSDFEKWSFGKLSAMREVVLAQEGGYQFYYMGYYIHSCVKMRYKGEYRPSHMLDPETNEWTLLDGEVRQLLDMKRYVSLSREHRRRAEAGAVDGESHGKDHVSEDDYSDYPKPTAAEAASAVKEGMSLLDLKVPGLMTVAEIEQEIDLDTQQIKVRGRPGTFDAQALVSWDTGDIRDPATLKGIIGELVACIGSEAAVQVVVDLT
ncbi:arginine-tRNA-protein transferase 1 [Polyplosphaeria fusca]|uniref:arginyltransferase n=1 Tax=Polyplosphaeria fusca TaxID=682080 RepID=A0A9P4QH20_9PLEO|nr:arginine-tRNA-protein transferase 1 [Polyplosphaeria fusca]